MQHLQPAQSIEAQTPVEPQLASEPQLQHGAYARLASRALRARSQRGMTLIEILVVLAIIGLIMGGVGIMAFQQLDGAKLKTAAKDIGTLVQSVEMYQLQKGKCPKSTQDLKAAGIISKVTKDPWGADYEIKCPGEHGSVDISSAGKDGQMGNEDDINSWDEAPGATKDEDE